MSLSPAVIVHKGNAAGGVMPDISSALGYKEHIGSACISPNGYTAGSYFVGADDGYFYCVTANIAAGDTITIGTNCVQTDVAAEIKQITSDLTELNVLVDNVKYTAATSAIQFDNSFNHYKIYLRDANSRIGMADYYPNIGNTLSSILVEMFDSNNLKNEVWIKNTNGTLTYQVITISTYGAQYGVYVTIVGLDTV